MDQSAQNQPTIPVQQNVSTVISEQTNPAEETSKLPAQPTGSASKEVAPASMVVEKTQEVIKPTETEPVVIPELKEAGVAAIPSANQPVIPKEVKEIVTPVKTAVPVPTEPTGLIQLPMAENEAETFAKKSKVTESIKWLAMLIVEQSRRARAQLTKKV